MHTSLVYRNDGSNDSLGHTYLLVTRRSRYSARSLPKHVCRRAQRCSTALTAKKCTRRTHFPLILYFSPLFLRHLLISTHHHVGVVRARASSGNNPANGSVQIPFFSMTIVIDGSPTDRGGEWMDTCHLTSPASLTLHHRNGTLDLMRPKNTHL